MPDPGPTPRVLVLYDEDCGFCRASLHAVLVLDPRRRLAVAPIQDPAAQALLADAGVPPERRLASAHAVALGAPAEALLSGGDAAPLVLGALAGRAGDIVGRLVPPMLARAAYRLVASNRSTLGRGVSGSRRAAADEAIARRRVETPWPAPMAR